MHLLKLLAFISLISYTFGASCHYTYDNTLSGPSNWATYCSNPDCDGSSQSPIDIKDADAVADSNLMALSTQYGASVDYELRNTGHNIQIDVDDRSLSTTIGGESLPLIQFHLHVLSEHTFEGASKSAEVHLVHILDSKITVVGIAFEADASVTTEDPFIAALTPMLPLLSGNSTNVTLNLATLGESVNDKEYYTYSGSLTTPPCSESVQFYIMKDARAITVDQFNALQTVPVLKGNARPVQPLNSRQVSKFVPSSLEPTSPTVAPVDTSAPVDASTGSLLQLSFAALLVVYAFVL